MFAGSVAKFAISIKILIYKVKNMTRDGEDRFLWLDTLRGWAVFGVLLVHIGQSLHSYGSTALSIVTDAGKFGVQLFFVISAYTICLTYKQHLECYGPSFRSRLGWYCKRFFRIAPLYYLAAIFYSIERFLIYSATGHQYGGMPWPFDSYLLHFVFLHTWSPSAFNSVVPGGWSIGVEAFFYLLAPSILLLIDKRRYFALVGMSLGFLCISQLALVSNLLDKDFLWHWFPTQFPVFAIGIIFFGLSQSNDMLQGGGNFLSRYQWLLFGMVVLIGCMTIYFEGEGPLWSPTLMGVVFVVVMNIKKGVDTVSWFDVNISRLGKLSYSIYLTHFAALDIVRFFLKKYHPNIPLLLLMIVVTAFVLFASTISSIFLKRYIEDPMIRVGHRFSRLICGAA